MNDTRETGFLIPSRPPSILTPSLSQVYHPMRHFEMFVVSSVGMLLWFGIHHALSPSRASIPVSVAQVVNTYPHDRSAFTEGLFYQDGSLYESTGRVGHSTVRRVTLDTGKVIQSESLPPSYFGEGIVPWKDRLLQVTYKAGKGFVYDRATLKLQSTFTYAGEGWGLTTDGQHVWMSDGTATLRQLDPETLKQVGSLNVTAAGRPISNLNELEWVKGEIYANVWLTSKIARIDPKTGHVVGWIDLSGLVPARSQLPDPANDVANGIAYDAAGDRLFVTGKEWPSVYQVKLSSP